MKKMIIDSIEKYKIIAIVRGVSQDKIIPAAQALYKGGIRLIEVTYDQSSPDSITETPRMIEMLCQHFGEDMCVGAGTVMNLPQVEAAVKAGAKYMISPNTNIKVIKRSVELGAISIPGALTPSEITEAYNAGASFVKLFPAGDLGVNYIKSVRSPINHIPLLAVGGIDETNMMEFFKAGIKGVGIGSNIVKTSLINENRFEELTALAEKYTGQVLF